MPPIQSKIDPGAEDFKRNRAAMLALIDQFRDLEGRVRSASERAKPRFESRGQILPRERLARLLDPGAPFLELSPLAGYRLDTDDPAKSIPGGSHIAGIGYVAGVRAMIVPGSGLVKNQAEEEGLDRIFKDAGFDWREPGCSMCLAMNADKLTPGERCASTSNRNFEGRQGRGGRTHLVSPGMAAAAAFAGHLADVRELI